MSGLDKMGDIRSGIKLSLSKRGAGVSQQISGLDKKDDNKVEYQTPLSKLERGRGSVRG